MSRRDPTTWRSMLRQVAVEWWDDDTFSLAAALAFYTVFSLAPIIVVTIAVAGLVVGEQVAARELVAQIRALVGDSGARAIQDVITSARASEGGAMAAVLGVATVLIGSTAVFAELQTALNKIWDVQATTERGAIQQLLRNRLLSFGLVLAVGFLLLVSLVVSAVLSFVRDVMTIRLPPLLWAWQALDVLVSFALVTVLFAAVYKVLPDVKLAWRDVAVGAAVTAFLFAVGKYLIGLYLGRSTFGSTYGAAGSFVVLLVWVYYSALVCFFGAEFTHVYATRMGSHAEPEEYAEEQGRKVDEEAEEAGIVPGRADAPPFPVAGDAHRERRARQ